MSDCNCFTPLLEKYFDGELSPEEKNSTEKHLKGCLRCRRQLKVLSAMRDLLLRAMEEVVADADIQSIWEGVEEKLSVPSPGEKVSSWIRNLFFPFWRLRSIACGLAFSAILFITVTMLTTTPPPTIVVKSVESKAPVMVFQEEEGMTIIWFFDRKMERS